MNPKVTVYITSHNYASYIKQAIESVLNQTYPNFELIIIDDGSTDNSRKIINLYKDRKDVKIIFQENKGLNATNNVAIHNASGKYIIRLDADDFLQPEALGVMVSIMESDEELGLIFPDYYYVDKDGQRVGTHRRHFFDDEVTLYDQPAHGACTMVRLEFLKKLGGYDESFSCQDGFDLWIKFITFHKVTNVSRPLFSYRQHDYNLTTDQDKILETRRQIKRKFSEKYIKPVETLAIIPVRNRIFKGESFPLYAFDNKTVLDHRIESCFKAKTISHIVVTTSDPEVLEHLYQHYSNDDRLSILERPKQLAAYDIKLNKTIDFVLERQEKAYEALALVQIEYPFLSSIHIDEALDTLQIFQSESLISVKPSKGPFYRHNGKTLKAILDQDKYTSYEREALYESAGGIMVSTLEAFKTNKSLIGARVSHLIVNQENSFGVLNSFQFRLFKMMLSHKAHSVESKKYIKTKALK